MTLPKHSRMIDHIFETHFVLKFKCFFHCAVALARNVQNMKPVQNCTDFIIYLFHAFVHT